MFILKKVFCRVYQAMFHAALPLLPYREPGLCRSVTELKGILGDVNKVLVVTDRGIMKNGIAQPLFDMLEKNAVEYAVYDGTQPNPTVKNVEDARAMYLKKGCAAMIAIGGGSAMDCAKAVGARIAYPRRSMNSLKGNLTVLRKLPMIIAIPTTAGTGSEATLTAVITDSERKYKYTLNSFPLIPHTAVLDANLTRTLPPSLTATTGIDALTHAVEAYIGRSNTDKTKKLCLDATKLVFENIERAYINGNDLEARDNMLTAAYKAGVAFSRAYVGYVHAVAHSLGGQYGIPHGLANSVLMPIVLEAYGKSAEKKLHELAIAAGVSAASESSSEGARKFIAAIRELNRRMGIPETIEGIREEDIPVMAKHAEREANPLYPVPRLMTEKELMQFYYTVKGSR